MTKLHCLLTLAAMVGSAAAQSGDEEEKKLINTLMQRQDVIAVNNAAEGFVPDHDLNTLQVVILTDPNAKGSVSPDGEVVFLPSSLTQNEQANLTYEAFRRKAKRILAIKVSPAPTSQ